MQIDCCDGFDNEDFEMRGLNLDQLRTLLAVVESGSFSAAARKLHLSQPAVSVQIRELERRFAVKLIERLGKRAHATPPGRDLVGAAEHIFRACDQADAVMRRYRDGWIGRARIGTTITAQMYMLPPILRKLSQDHPGIDLHVRNLPTRESIAAILQNEIDLAIVTMPVDKAQLTVTPIWSEPMVAIHPSIARDVPDKVTPEYVLRQALLLEHVQAGVHQLVMQWLSGHGAAPRVRMHLGTIEAVKSAVASNLGMSIVPQMAASRSESDLIVRPLHPPLVRTLALIEHRSKPNEPAIEIVRNALLGLRDADVIAPSRRPSKRSTGPVASRSARRGRNAASS
jgi:DNA-binding transcriptional LysR family regulator